MMVYCQSNFAYTDIVEIITMSIKKSVAQTPQVIEYAPLHLPSEFEDNNSFRKKLKDSILLQVQGDPVEIKDSADIPTLMVTFDSLRKVCPEVVFRFTTGEQVLIFSHQAKDVLRPPEIIEGFVEFDWKEVGSEKKEEITIDLDALWEHVSKHGLLDRIKFALEAINEDLRKADKIILLGNSQSIIFLFAQYKCYEFADEIYYQKDNDSEPIRID